MEKKKLTTAAGAPVPDNDNAITAGPRPHAAAGHLVYQHFRKYEWCSNNEISGTDNDGNVML